MPRPKLNRRCGVPGCDRPHSSRGLCESHRRRLVKTGDARTHQPIRRTADSIEERILEKVSPEPNTGCWLWTGYTNGAGYGVLEIKDQPFRAHRLSYELFIGPIPEGLTLDHLCRVRCCVNPHHLEPVTIGDNVLRGDARTVSRARRAFNVSTITHCANGHEWTDVNTSYYSSGSRRCLTCCREHCREYYRKNREKVLARKRSHGI